MAPELASALLHLRSPRLPPQNMGRWPGTSSAAGSPLRGVPPPPGAPPLSGPAHVITPENWVKGRAAAAQANNSQACSRDSPASGCRNLRVFRVFLRGRRRHRHAKQVSKEKDRKQWKKQSISQSQEKKSVLSLCNLAVSVLLLGAEKPQLFWCYIILQARITFSS